MLEFLPSREDVIAIRCGGKLSADEMSDYLDRLEASLERRDKTHLYAEVVDFAGLETERLGEMVRRGAGYLRRLDRIGRVGIVADQDWIRWAAKLESALLPHVSYETFESDERERALAWVQGELESPRVPAVRIIDTDSPDVFGFELDGHAGKAELDALSAHFLKAIEGRERVRMLGRIRRIGGFDLGGLMSSDYFAMKRGFLERLDRYAVVGGPAWLKSALAALAPLFRAELRHFEPEAEDEAWAWLGARPVAERTLVD